MSDIAIDCKMLCHKEMPLTLCDTKAEWQGKALVGLDWAMVTVVTEVVKPMWSLTIACACLAWCFKVHLGTNSTFLLFVTCSLKRTLWILVVGLTL